MNRRVTIDACVRQADHVTCVADGMSLLSCVRGDVLTVTDVRMNKIVRTLRYASAPLEYKPKVEKKPISNRS